MRLLFLCSLTLPGPLAHADTGKAVLRCNKSGTVYGPFAITNGAPLQLRGVAFTVSAIAAGPAARYSS